MSILEKLTGWVAGLGIASAGGWMIGGKTGFRIALIGGLLIGGLVFWHGIKSGWINHGIEIANRKWFGAARDVELENRAREKMVDSGISARSEGWAAKKRRIRQRGSDERLWISKREKIDGRIDPQTMDMLEGR